MLGSRSLGFLNTRYIPTSLKEVVDLKSSTNKLTHQMFDDGGGNLDWDVR